MGVDSSVLTLSSDPKAILQVENHKVHQANLDFYLASTGFSVSLFKKFSKISEQADVIHYHFPWPMIDLVHLLCRPSKPTIVTYHSDIVKQRFLGKLYAPLMHLFLGSVDKIVATSPNYLETSKVLQRWEAKTTVVPIGIDERVPPGKTILNRWRGRVGDNFFLFVGALRYYKGLSYLLEAARATGLPVVIAGKGESDFHIGDALPNVHFVGEITDSDKEALLSLCRAFVFPSHLRSEAFGVALLEAARAGKPMISCEIGTGTSYVNKDGETGIVVPPASSEALADAMKTLAGEHDLVERFGVAARQRYETLFRAEDMCAGYYDIYAQLIADHRQKKTS